MQCSLHVRAVIKRSDFDLGAVHYQVCNRTVVCTIEGKRLCTAGVGNQMPDHASVHYRYDFLIRVCGVYPSKTAH